MNRFDRLYNKIITEGKWQFRGSRDLPSKFLANLPNVKCTLSQHFLDRYYQRFDIRLITPDMIYRNVQLFLLKIFNDKSCILFIKLNLSEHLPLNFYCSTVLQFHGKKGSHLCVIIKINSNTNEKGERLYYCLLTTLFVDNDQEYDQLIKTGYTSTKHLLNIPVTIIGLSFLQIFGK